MLFDELFELLNLIFDLIHQIGRDGVARHGYIQSQTFGVLSEYDQLRPGVEFSDCLTTPG